MELSCSLPPGPRTVEYAQLAEALGYRRLWLYDSPLLYPDVWMTLARVAEATTTLGLGPGVLVPGLRHVATTAAAIATLESLAPGRVAAAVGTGFTARRLLGRPPLAWKHVETFVRELRALLRGDVAPIDGRPVRMLHPEGFAPPRPLATPILVAANGPRGCAVAQQLGDGVMAIAEPPEGFAWCAVARSGTVLEPGETLTTPRVVEALGPAIALIYHATYEAAGPGVDQLPGGRAWREATEQVPEAQRHHHIHEGHCVAVPDRERPLLDPQVGAMTFTGSAAELHQGAVALEHAGATELLYSPTGPDIPRELRAMARALHDR
ncbi:MAG: LLM class flavin-dependent oxidoreductase [Deltaproteobacteria bacterium]|nr:LLM class flavin-dependent oxidoreductase [Deltaproteobacteria bacterium]MBW2361556.1 LLM class flavin-dependent oxidoreductase [Deltaproteobacteria bacterium]